MSMIVTGDDVAIPVQLKKGGSTFTIDGGATVKAAIVTPERDELLSTTVTCSNIATGADWDNSLVVVEMTSAQTAAITTYGNALVEVQVDDSGKLTWAAPIYVARGLIS